MRSTTRNDVAVWEGDGKPTELTKSDTALDPEQLRTSGTSRSGGRGEGAVTDDLEGSLQLAFTPWLLAPLGSQETPYCWSELRPVPGNALGGIALAAPQRLGREFSGIEELAGSSAITHPVMRRNRSSTHGDQPERACRQPRFDWDGVR